MLRSLVGSEMCIRDRFNSIRTSLENKQRITELTNKLSLGAENVIARIALSYSLSKESKLELADIKDSKGKEYSKRVLVGEYYFLYVAMVCQKYQLHNLNKEVPRYLKLHIDDGIEKIDSELKDNPNILGIDLLLSYVENGLI